MKTLFLRDSEGRLIRAVSCGAKKAFIVYRHKPRRLEVCSSPGFFKTGRVTVLKEVLLEDLRRGPAVLETGISLEAPDSRPADQPENISPFPFIEPEDSKALRQAAFSVTGLFAALAAALFLLSGGPPKEAALPEKPRIVRIIKPPQIAKIEKIAIDSQTSYTRASPASRKKRKPLKKSLKKRGALAALGSLSKSRRPAGLRLGAAKVSSGPGLKASSPQSGSGGMQSAIYSKGLIGAALGAGGNIRGGGGYGLKGQVQGGGQAGAGQLALTGSEGSWDLSQTSLLSRQGGSFDPSLIDREIVRHAGKIRACYSEALLREPKLKGLFSAQFTINSQGRVASSRRHPSSPVRSPALTSCILGALNKIKFNLRRENKDLISVVYPFDLAALEGAPLGTDSFRERE